jgi:hypothetical protein
MGDEHVEMAALILELLGTDSDREDAEALIAKHLREASRAGYARCQADVVAFLRSDAERLDRKVGPAAGDVGRVNALLSRIHAIGGIAAALEEGAHVGAAQNGGGDDEA